MTARFPLGPLLDRVRSASGLARAANLDQSTVYQAVKRGGGLLSLRQADEWAVRAGFHPWEIWGDQWLDPEAYEEGMRG